MQGNTYNCPKTHILIALNKQGSDIHHVHVHVHAKVYMYIHGDAKNDTAAGPLCCAEGWEISGV